MTQDYTKLRELAEKAKEPIPDSAHEFIAAASPDVILGLLDEIDALEASPFSEEALDILRAERDADRAAMRTVIDELDKQYEPGGLQRATNAINALRARLGDVK